MMNFIVGDPVSAALKNGDPNGWCIHFAQMMNVVVCDNVPLILLE